MSNLIAELLLRLVKPFAALTFGTLLYLGLIAFGVSSSAELLLLSWASAGVLILLMQESPL
jgi:hypothetical protein